MKPAGTLNRYATTGRRTTLGDVPLEEIVSELLVRIRQDVFASESTVLLGCQVHDALRVALDIDCNRMSRARYRNMFGLFQELLTYTNVDIERATIVDLGCGSINPYGLLFVFLMLGARCGIAIDLDEIQDVPRAVQAVADCASMMLMNPEGLVGEYPITREQALRNIASFDLAKLEVGDSSGIDPERLRYLRESTFALSLDDGEVDLVISNAVFEHIPRVEAAVAELARITRKGGLHIHNIDGSDHRRYWDRRYHPLTFLTEASTDVLTHGSNRIRPYDFIPLFEQHGFELIAFTPFESTEVSAELRAQLIEPFKSMSAEVLCTIGGRLLLQRT